MEGISTLRCLMGDVKHAIHCTDPVSETLCSLEYRTMDRVQELSNPECYIPSSEPIRIDYISRSTSITFPHVSLGL
jgi:hypothetical protein